MKSSSKICSMLIVLSTIQFATAQHYGRRYHIHEPDFRIGREEHPDLAWNEPADTEELCSRFCRLRTHGSWLEGKYYQPDPYRADLTNGGTLSFMDGNQCYCYSPGWTVMAPYKPYDHMSAKKRIRARADTMIQLSKERGYCQQPEASCSGQGCWG